MELKVKRFKISDNLINLKIILKVIDFLEIEIKEILIKEYPEMKNELFNYSRSEILEKAKEYGIILNDEFNSIKEWRDKKKVIFEPTEEFIPSIQEVNNIFFGTKQIFENVVKRKNRKELIYAYGKK